MPNFQAKKKEEFQQKPELYPAETMQPGESVPVADENGLRELGATEFYPRSWEYRHPEHTLTDIKRPGYFTDEAREHLRPGDEIYFCLRGGKKLPSEWERGIAVVEEVPNSKELPVVLAGLAIFPKATPWTE